MKKLLVVCGDINSHSGYASAIRRYVAAIESCFDAIVACDLHPAPGSVGKASSFPYPEIDILDLPYVKNSWDGIVIVLSVTTPDHFVRIRDCHNIGCFFWETDRIPERWHSSIRAMDEIWTPMKFLVPELRRIDPNQRIFVFPCPLVAADRGAAQAYQPEIFFEQMSGDPQAAKVITFGQIRQMHKTVGLVVSSQIGRKGLPLLWREIAQLQKAGRDLALVVKLSSINVNDSQTDILERARNEIELAFARVGIIPEKIYLTAAKLPAAAMDHLYQSADLFVTTTLGEGMGLGVFDSISQGKPALCPRHTSFADYLPDDYLFFMDADVANVEIDDPARVHPIASKWGLMKEFELIKAFDRYSSKDSWRDEMEGVSRSIHKSIDQYTKDVLERLNALGAN